jgi:hypothetical protein
VNSHESVFWLRIFSSEDIFVAELPKPHELSITNNWIESTAGGARYVKNNETQRIVENPYWPINPQYLLKFEHNTSAKIILRKTCGIFTAEDDKIGMIITKPYIEDNSLQQLQLANKGKKYAKNDQIVKILESTDCILENKTCDLNKIERKLSFNSSEYVVESAYSNHYCSSVFLKLNKINSPLIIIPTLAKEESCFEFKLSGKHKY